MIYATSFLLCRRHHRAVHEGRVKVSVNRDGTVLFFTPKGRMLADAPKPRRWMDTSEPEWTDGSKVWTDGSKKPAGADTEPGASSMGEGLALTNGAALYPDSAIPWEIEAAAREAMEESADS